MRMKFFSVRTKIYREYAFRTKSVSFLFSFSFVRALNRQNQVKKSNKTVTASLVAFCD